MRRVGAASSAVIALLATAALVLPGAAAAQTNSTIVYQCGYSICSIDPTGGSPQTLAQSGDLAGLTADGTTYGYQPGAGQGGVWEAPVAGGTPTEVVDYDTDSPILDMSPNGQYFIGAIDDLEFGDKGYLYKIALGPNASPSALDYEPQPGAITYGWSGSTPLTTHSAATSWVCIGGQQQDPGGLVYYCGAGDPTAKIQSSTNDVVYPSGSPDGTEIVAVVAPFNGFAGAIAIYSASTGAFIRTIATPPAGTTYTDPRFSPDSTQVVFESDSASTPNTSSLDIVNADGSGLKTIATGANPFWGAAPAAAAPTPAPSPAPTSKAVPRAARVSLKVPHQDLAIARRDKRLRVTCTLAGAGRCTVRATITRTLARRLSFTIRRKAKTYTVATVSRTLKKRGKVVLTLKLTAKQARALRRVRSLRLTLTATSTAAGHRARVTAKTITLR